MEVLVDMESPNLDIVLVHGLNIWSNPTHPHDTWSCVSPSGETVHWARDFLPLSEELVRARVLAFSYNANTVLRTARTGIGVQAESLLENLRQVRRGLAPRPLIFIAHSLGGLIVKDALVQARTGNGRYASLWFFTLGIMFFGTPHRGATTEMHTILAKTAQTLMAEVDPGFLDSLGLYGQAAMDLHQKFQLVHAHYSYISVDETKPHRIKALGVVVPRESALLGLSDDRETRISLNRDHNSICKFSSPEDSDFQLVLKPLEELARKAIQAFMDPYSWNRQPTPYLVLGRIRRISFKGSSSLDNTFIEEDRDLSFSEAIQLARDTIVSVETPTALHELDAEIQGYQISTSSTATIFLIPLITSLMPILTALLLLGRIFGTGSLGPAAPLIQQIENKLGQLQTSQQAVYNLTRFKIQLLHDKCQAVVVAAEILSQQLSKQPPPSDTEGEAMRDLEAALGAHRTALETEIRYQLPYSQLTQLRVTETIGFRRQLQQAQQAARDGNWLRELIAILHSLFEFLENLVREIAASLRDALVRGITYLSTFIWDSEV